MIKLENFIATEKQQAVLNKYGWNTIEKLANRAWLSYWRIIKESLDSTIPYDSVNNQYLYIQNNLVIAILDYIYKNDNELKIQYDDDNK